MIINIDKNIFLFEIIKLLELKQIKNLLNVNKYLNKILERIIGNYICQFLVYKSYRNSKIFINKIKSIKTIENSFLFLKYLVNIINNNYQKNLQKNSFKNFKSKSILTIRQGTVNKLNSHKKYEIKFYENKSIYISYFTFKHRNKYLRKTNPLVESLSLAYPVI